MCRGRSATSRKNSGGSKTAAPADGTDQARLISDAISPTEKPTKGHQRRKKKKKPQNDRRSHVGVKINNGCNKKLFPSDQRAK